MIYVYTGTGKGKTSACLGQALRAMGHGYIVTFCQFIKREGTAGEQRSLAALLGANFAANGLGFVSNSGEEKRCEHAERARELLRFAERALGTSWLVVLDEVLYALHYNLLSREEITSFLQKAEEAGCHLILSGRHAPEWLIAMADLVTEMHTIAHPFKEGKKAVRGLDY